MRTGLPKRDATFLGNGFFTPGDWRRVPPREAKNLSFLCTLGAHVSDMSGVFRETEITAMSRSCLVELRGAAGAFGSFDITKLTDEQLRIGQEIARAAAVGIGDVD